MVNFFAFKKWILAVRPQTLVAAWAPILIGGAFVYQRYGLLNFQIFYTILFGASCIQIATNFFNDALDAEKGRDLKERLGPKRFSGADPGFAKQLKLAAYVLLGLGFLSGVVLSVHSSVIIFFVGFPALFLSYLYTGTKYSLSETGLADLFVILYFGILPSSLTEYILSGKLSFETFLAGLQCGLFCNALLLINNLRDQKEDASTGKKTLVVRFGRKGGLLLLLLCLVVPYGAHLYWMNTLFFRASLWTMWLLLVSILLFLKVVFTPPSSKYNAFLGVSALHLILFSICFSFGVLSS